jgi:membrane protein implicated in regulation of membrane protease activity
MTYWLGCLLAGFFLLPLLACLLTRWLLVACLLAGWLACLLPGWSLLACFFLHACMLANLTWEKLPQEDSTPQKKENTNASIYL